MRHSYNLAKPYLYFLKNPDPPNNQHFLKKSFSYSTSGHSHKTKMFVSIAPIYKLGGMGGLSLTRNANT